MKLGDDYQYPIKVTGESSYKLDSVLDAKGMRVAFVYGQVLIWPRGNTIDSAIVNGEQEGGL